MRKTVLALVTLLLAVAFTAGVSFAADTKAMGTVKSVDAAKGTIVFCPSGTKEDITMKADKEMLKGVKAGDKVNIEYSADKTVKTMRKARGGKVPVGC